MTWVYSSPIWLVSALFIGGTGAVAAGGLMIVRSPRTGRFTGAANDFAGPVMGTLGTILAVMLSFMVVTVWQTYEQSASVVESEVDSLSNLYHEASVFPEPQKSEVHDAIQRYVNLAVNDEWPMMRVGRSSHQARVAAVRIVLLIERYAPKTLAQQTAQADALRHAHEFLADRGDRLFQNVETVPTLLWAMMIFVATITLCSSYFFHVSDARAHFAMTVALGAVIGAFFVVIAELDLPFRGDLQIQPTAYARAYTAFADDRS